MLPSAELKILRLDALFALSRQVEQRVESTKELAEELVVALASEVMISTILDLVVLVKSKLQHPNLSCCARTQVALGPDTVFGSCGGQKQ